MSQTTTAYARTVSTMLISVAGLLAVTAVRSVSAVPGLPEMGGHAQYETFGYPDPGSESPGWESFFEVALHGRGRLGSTLGYSFETLLVADDVGFTAGGFSPRNRSSRRPYLSLISAVLDYRPLAGLRVSIGKQILKWSTIDEIQPANLMATTDSSDPFRPIDQGLYGVELHYERDFGVLDVVVVPMAFTPSRLPQGRWNIVSTEGGVEERNELPPVAFNETQAALRLGKQFGQMEVSLIGYVGRDTFAIFVPELIFVGGVERFRLRIVDRYPRLWAGGFNTSQPVGERLLLRAESIYFSSPDEERDNFFHSVVGGEYSLDDWRVVLNYFRDDRTDRATEEVTDKGRRRFFRSFLFGGIAYDAGGRLRAELTGGYDFDNEFVILHPQVSYGIRRDLRATLSGEIIQANRFSYFDRIRHEDRIGMALTYSF